MAASSKDAATAARYYLKTLSRMYGGREASDAAIDELLGLAAPQGCTAGTVLAREGAPADCAFFVVEGRVRASILAGQDERVVNEALPGEIIGEAGIFLTGAQRSATMTASEHSTYLVLRRELFRASAHNPALIAMEQHLLRMLVRRIANTDAQMTRAWRESASGGAPLDGLSMLLGSSK